MEKEFLKGYDGVFPWDVFRGFIHALRKDATYYDWMTSSAAQSSLVALDRDYTQEIKESMGENWKSRLLSKKFLPTIIQGLQKMSEFSEYATRIAVYKKRKAEYEKAGMDARDAVLSAALRSRDLIDFGRHGKSVFTTDDSLLKMLYLAMVDITNKWTGRRQDWSIIHAQMVIYFEDRLSE